MRDNYSMPACGISALGKALLIGWLITGPAGAAGKEALPARGAERNSPLRAAGKKSASIPDIIHSLSTQEKLGQMFMAAIDTEIALKDEPFIRSGRLGGALLRWDRFTGAEAKEFTARMQIWASSAPHPLPFLIAADHEGGPLFTQRMYGATLFPGNMALGAVGSPRLAEQAAAVSAQELRALGIHIDFAPDLDVNNNPDNPIIGVRSFGEDPNAVASLGVAAIRGYQEGGIIPVAKHFPGHGDTAVDSHLDMPVIRKSLGELRKVEFVPFQSAIKAGVPMIMPAHILFPALAQGQMSVTLSSAAIEGLLRKKMGFNGIVASDSLDMGSIAKTYGIGEASVRAVEAGCDILLIGKADLSDAFNQTLEAVKSGRIPQKRLDRSVDRILKIKKRLGLIGGHEPAILPFERIGREKYQRLAQDIADRAVTLLRNDDHLIPFGLPEEKNLVVILSRHNRYAQEMEIFSKEVLTFHPKTQILQLSQKPDEASVRDALTTAQNADVLVVGTYQWGTAEFKEQTAMIRRLESLGKPTLAISLMNPYDLRYFPEIKTMLCTYGITPASMRAAARLLFGKIKSRGKLPVTIPGLFPRGSGLGGVETPRER